MLDPCWTKVTTGGTFNSQFATSKLYRLDFNSDFSGGNISMVLDRTQLDTTGTPPFPANTAMFDNMTVGLDGKVYIQEDPGNNNYIARVWQVDLSNPTAAVQIFESDRDRFVTGVPGFVTIDEEHSGIIDVTNLFNGVEGDAASWYVPGTKLFLADTQSHLFVGGSIVEGGQLQLLAFSPSAIPEPASFAALAGLAGLGLAASRRRRA